LWEEGVCRTIYEELKNILWLCWIKKLFIEEVSEKRHSVRTQAVKHMGGLIYTTSMQVDRRIK